MFNSKRAFRDADDEAMELGLAGSGKQLRQTHLVVLTESVTPAQE